MSDDDRATAHDIVTGGLPAGVIPTSAVLVAAGLDPESGEEQLYIRRDTDAGIWKHIGMLTIALDDLRGDCRLDDSDT